MLKRYFSRIVGWDSIAAGARVIRQSAVTLRENERHRNEDASVNWYQEAFAADVAERGLSIADLAAKYSRAKVAAVFSAVSAVIAMGFTAFEWGPKSAPSLGALSCVMIVVCLTLYFVRYSLYCYQLRHREFSGFGDWLAAPWEWWPGSFGPAPKR